MADWSVKGAWKSAVSAFESTHSKIGGFVAAGIAVVAASIGIKTWSDRQEQNKMEYARQQAEATQALKAQVISKRMEISQMCEKVGQFNRPSGHFRQMVRGNGMEAPGKKRQPEPDIGQPVEIVQDSSLPI